MMLRRTALFILLIAGLCAAMPSRAQDDEYFSKEIGFGLGGNFMLNDANSTPFGQMNVGIAGLMRFVLNPRSAIKTELSYHTIGGNLTSVSDFYPATTNAVTADRLAYNFSGGLASLTGLYELHFLPYGYYRSYLGHQRITPFVQLGMGFTYSTVGKKLTANFPLGIGVKYKLRRQLNLAIDLRMHLTPSDQLDGLEAPKGIRSEMFRNKDHFATMMITLTYDFDKKCRTCNKAD